MKILLFRSRSALNLSPIRLVKKLSPPACSVSADVAKIWPPTFRLMMLLLEPATGRGCAACVFSFAACPSICVWARGDKVTGRPTKHRLFEVQKNLKNRSVALEKVAFLGTCMTVSAGNVILEPVKLSGLEIFIS